MSVHTTSVSLDDVNLLTDKLSAIGIGINDIIDILDADDPIATLSNALQGTMTYPQQWGKPKFYEFHYTMESRWESSPLHTTLDDIGVRYSACADCNSNARVWYRNSDYHLSMRMSDFIQLGPSLQVKATPHGIQVIKPRPYKQRFICGGAGD